MFDCLRWFRWICHQKCSILKTGEKPKIQQTDGLLSKASYQKFLGFDFQLPGRMNRLIQYHSRTWYHMLWPKKCKPQILCQLKNKQVSIDTTEMIIKYTNTVESILHQRLIEQKYCTSQTKVRSGTRQRAHSPCKSSLQSAPFH